MKGREALQSRINWCEGMEAGDGCIVAVSTASTSC